ncbi:SKP1-like protein 4 [Oryza brachyantha]|uniref:SKP1-like protein 4 n=1 Tax=Oryza brachyantha TaxID=4533 RepID=UPI001ADB1188|nr:SKP1-like protein 4 [Oryza brachyantha]
MSATEASGGGGGVIRTVTLRGYDGARVRAPAGTMAAASATAKARLDEAARRAGAGVLPGDVLINVPDVDRPVLARVADYCDRHYGGGDAFNAPAGYGFDDPLQVFDDELMAGAGVDTLVDLLRAATFLRVAKLVDLAAREVARRMRGKTVEETRALFGIRSDYTKQEVEDIRNEISWAFYTCHDD